MGAWSLVTGWLPWTIRVAGVVALVVLLGSRQRRFWTLRVPAALVAAALAVAAVDVVVDVLWHPFPDRIPVNNLVWGWVGVAALLLAALRLPSLRWWGRGCAVVAALTVVVAAASAVNGYWGMYPTVHALYDTLRPPTPVPLPDPAPAGGVVVAPPGGTLVGVWHPPSTMPTMGTVSQVHIAGTRSRFRARDAYVYLPPAYRVSPRPLLPVIVLLAGQPGAPGDWVTALGLAGVMDAYAHSHEGLAPVAVVVDDLGSRMANPLCVDSPLGNVETYLAIDVPGWIRATLQVATGRDGWFIGGYSHGGTCSLQLAVRAPDVYGGFVDISGQREPTLGSRTRTIQAAFGGSAAAFARVNPLDMLKHTRYAGTAGLIVAGSADTVYRPQQREVHAACQAAGMDTQYAEVSGGHTMTGWREAFRAALPWLGRHGRITDG